MSRVTLIPPIPEMANTQSRSIVIAKGFLLRVCRMEFASCKSPPLKPRHSVEKDVVTRKRKKGEIKNPATQETRRPLWTRVLDV